MLDNQSESIICNEGGTKFYYGQTLNRWLAEECCRPDSKTLLILAHVSNIPSYWWKSCKSSWVHAPLLFESMTCQKKMLQSFCVSQTLAPTQGRAASHACSQRKKNMITSHLCDFLYILNISSLHMPSVYGYITMLAWCLEHFRLHMNVLGGVNAR